jgi:hypothetical protein
MNWPKFPGGPVSKLKLQSSLEELRRAFEVEAIEASDTVEAFETKVVGQIPVRSRREALELTSGDLFAVEVDIGEACDQLHGAVAAGEQGPPGDDLSEGSLDGVVGAGLSGDAPCCNEVAAVNRRAAYGWGRGANPPVFAAEEQGAFPVAGFISRILVLVAANLPVSTK